jgi:hypothetical protein
MVYLLDTVMNNIGTFGDEARKTVGSPGVFRKHKGTLSDFVALG